MKTIKVWVVVSISSRGDCRSVVSMVDAETALRTAKTQWPGPHQRFPTEIECEVTDDFVPTRRGRRPKYLG